jgi:hypothetical protein
MVIAFGSVGCLYRVYNWHVRLVWLVRLGGALAVVGHESEGGRGRVEESERMREGEGERVVARPVDEVRALL